MTSAPLLIALPSKGRIMDEAQSLFARAGFSVERTGSVRGYRGTVSGMADTEVTFLSSMEIAQALKEGSVDIGITGEDLVREASADSDGVLSVSLRLGFAPADVVVAVPQCWLDVATMSDLDEVSVAFYAGHGRRLRVATKYSGLTRRFFAAKGVAGYRIVESLGATEGAPAAGTAEVIVDITTTGSTLQANQLKVLDDGVILKSEAVLACQKAIAGQPRIVDLRDRLESVL